jgi:hypothetical protein
MFSNLGYAARGSVISLVFKDISKTFARSAIVCAIESLEKMEDCNKKQYLISHYQDLLERNDRS